MDYIIDTEGDIELVEKPTLAESERQHFLEAEEDALADLVANVKIVANKIAEDGRKEISFKERLGDWKVQNAILDFYQEMGWGTKIGEQSFRDKLKRSRDRFNFDDVDMEKGTLRMEAMKVDVDKEMEKSVIRPGFEKQVTLPEYNVSDKRLRAMRKKERDKTKGPSWYNMAAPEITDELKNDLEILKMRSALDPKHFYKKNDMEALPKYFQVGKVIDSPLDHTNVRLTKKERKRTLVDELLADAEFNKYNKKKYKEIIEERRKSTYKTYIKDKRKKNKELFKKNKDVYKKKKKEVVKPKKTSRYS